MVYDWMLIIISVISVIFILLYTARLLIGRRCRNGALHSRGVKSDFNVWIVLGSGGHTAEMLRIVSNLGPRYNKRRYILADTDKTSLCKLHECEKMRECKVDFYDFFLVPRSREVGQSYLSSVFTTLHSFCKVLRLVFDSDSDLLLCNGPGTCLPICAAIFLKDLWKMCTLHFHFTPIIFVESVCRVKNLSLTGRILYFTGLADVIFVQWPDLLEKYSKVKLDNSPGFKNNLTDPYRLWSPLLQNNLDKDQALFDSYDWRDYLDKPKFTAAPVQAFYHSPLRNAWKRIGPGLKVEVPNRDYW
uniref:UDP-N-acetylglucosamine transferase subunit ALG14 n=1 Tax=Romanomermis culicivorax TaxID=13658 RepID=A0A915IH76_ROMCU